MENHKYWRINQLYRLEPHVVVFLSSWNADVDTNPPGNVVHSSGTEFRLVAGNILARGTYNFVHVRGEERWVLEVKRDYIHGFAIVLRAPESVKTFTYKPFVRTNNKDIHYSTPGGWMNKGGTSVVGAEVTVEPAVLSTDEMHNWDVVLCVDGTKFYAHKTILSFASTTFRSMFEGKYREKNQQEVPVNVEGTNAEHLEAFLQCLYPYGREPKGEFLVPLITLADFYNVKPLLEKSIDMLKVTPYVSNIVKLRVAIKVNSASLEDNVFASLTKADIGDLIAAGFKDLGDDLAASRESSPSATQ